MSATRISLVGRCRWCALATAILCAVGLHGCGGRDVAPGVTPSPKDVAERPLAGDFPEDTPLAIPEAGAGEVQETGSAADTPTALGAENASETAGATGLDARTQGFRVQIYAGHRRDRAEEVADQARAALGLPVYMVATPDYFKVHVGDCPGREDADVLVGRVRAAGYGDAWIVSALVKTGTVMD